MKLHPPPPRSERGWTPDQIIQREKIWLDAEVQMARVGKEKQSKLWSFLARCIPVIAPRLERFLHHSIDSDSDEMP